MPETKNNKVRFYGESLNPMYHVVRMWGGCYTLNVDGIVTDDMGIGDIDIMLRVKGTNARKILEFKRTFDEMGAPQYHPSKYEYNELRELALATNSKLLIIHHYVDELDDWRDWRFTVQYPLTDQPNETCGLIRLNEIMVGEKYSEQFFDRMQKEKFEDTRVARAKFYREEAQRLDPIYDTPDIDVYPGVSHASQYISIEQKHENDAANAMAAKSRRNEAIFI